MGTFYLIQPLVVGAPTHATKAALLYTPGQAYGNGLTNNSKMRGEKRRGISRGLGERGVGDTASWDDRMGCIA